MAHTKSQKTVAGNKDSKSKRLGVKIFGGQKVRTGNVIIRQKGSKFHAGNNVLKSKDFTLIALKDGIVQFKEVKGKKYVFVS